MSDGVGTFSKPAVYWTFLLLLIFGGALVESIDNGLGLTPPRGWRSWNAFPFHTNQARMLAQVDALVDRSRKDRNGNPVSLLDLGYDSIGLDDSWQACGKGINGSFHDKNGNPLIKPGWNFTAMNEYAHKHGIRSGWYLNNCECQETGRLVPNWPPQMHGDVNALVRYGFDGVKIDSCGPSKDIAMWERLINATGRQIMIENCHNNHTYQQMWLSKLTPSDNKPGALLSPDLCPFNFYRTGSDMRATWDRMIRNLESQVLTHNPNP